ncbi:hypothetical protein ACTFIT_008244, partial [Dictyostelium discoideum]
VMY